MSTRCPGVLITGATKGLGKALSLECLRAGRAVMGVYASDDAAAEEWRSTVAAKGADVALIKHDVSMEASDETTALIAAFVSQRTMTVFNCASAAFTPTPIHQVPWETYERLLSVNVRGALFALSCVRRAMLESGSGTFVNVLSEVTRGAPPKGFAPYVTAKSALQGLTKAIASELSPRNIKVFSVSPGFMETPLTSRWHPMLREMMGPSTPPNVAAARILALADDPSTAGAGEDYPVP